MNRVDRVVYHKSMLPGSSQLNPTKMMPVRIKPIWHLMVALMFLNTCAVSADEDATVLQTLAQKHRRILEEKVLPYWYRTTVDEAHGGYLLADPHSGSKDQIEKQLVTQSRMIWGFAHAWNKGFRSDSVSYLEAARQGYAFLMDRFYDRAHGGFYWSTDRSGSVTNDKKLLYGQAFVIYALVEYYRASGETQAINQAVELFHTLQKHAYDEEHGGWFEHFEPDWTWIQNPAEGAYVELTGHKSGNAHLHWMEALAELHEVTQSSEVRRALKESLEINRRYFYPLDPDASSFHQTPDWQRVSGGRSDGISYGHNVEFAWLMLRAQEVLGEPLDWGHFKAHIDHSLRYGFDHQRGGIYNLGMPKTKAHDQNKVWWCQSEMVAALAYAYQGPLTAHVSRPLRQTVEFLESHMIDPKDGIWYSSVSAEGEVLQSGKANVWKGMYHDFRGLMIFESAVD